MPTTEDIALAIVVRKQRVLVQKRYRQECGFLFEFPGGSPETNESWREAASRELYEETGLNESNCHDVIVKPSAVRSLIAFVIFSSSTHNEPLMVDNCRQQTFYWFEPSSIPLDDFHTADIEFIKHDLPEILSNIHR